MLKSVEVTRTTSVRPCKEAAAAAEARVSEGAGGGDEDAEKTTEVNDDKVTDLPQVKGYRIWQGSLY